MSMPRLAMKSSLIGFQFRTKRQNTKLILLILAIGHLFPVVLIKYSISYWITARFARAKSTVKNYHSHLLIAIDFIIIISRWAVNKSPSSYQYDFIVRCFFLNILVWKILNWYFLGFLDDFNVLILKIKREIFLK